MYTDKEYEDYENQSITLQLPNDNLNLQFVDMTTERVINWSYPDIMMVVSDDTYNIIEKQGSTENYIGYLVENHKTSNETSHALSAIKTPESKLSTYYSEYRLGIEGASFNVFILGFLGLIFLMATGSIIYFKQLTEASADKSRYDILVKVGVSNKEINKSIFKQNLFLFALPLLVELAHYLVILNLLKRLFSVMAGLNLALPIIICVATFIMIYAVYYVLTVNSITKMVNGGSTPLLRGIVIIIVLCLCVLIGALIRTVTPAPTEKYTGNKIQLQLPEPSGQYMVGTTEIHLVDQNRQDPWVKNKTRYLMISIYYPAVEESAQKAVYMKTNAAKYYDENILLSIGLDSGYIDLSEIITSSWINASVLESSEGWPVILYSPGANIPRVFGTTLVEELASKGYIVVTIDHTYDSSVIEFPDGRVVTEELPNFSAETVLKLLDVRVDDMKYVIEQLSTIVEGNNPDYENKELPIGLENNINLSKIGTFGHSAGGAASAQLMYEDERVDAGIDMDGTMGYMPDYPLNVAKYGLDRPFMLMNAGYNDEGEVDSHKSAIDRASFWENTNAWKIDVSIPNGAHFTFTDYLVLIPQIDNKLGISQQVIQGSIGSIDYNEVLEAQKKYITAFFDLHLKGIPQSIFDESSKYTDIYIIE